MVSYQKDAYLTILLKKLINIKTMETANLLFHFSVMLISLMVFFLKITAPNAFLELILKAIGKLIPLFCLLFAGVQIFKHFGLL